MSKNTKNSGKQQQQHGENAKSVSALDVFQSIDFNHNADTIFASLGLTESEMDSVEKFIHEKRAEYDKVSMVIQSAIEKYANEPAKLLVALYEIGYQKGAMFADAIKALIAMNDTLRKALMESARERLSELGIQLMQFSRDDMPEA